jgi:adenylate cyclase
LSAATLDELALWHHALQLYRAREWELAGLQIYNLQQRAPGCRLYALYAEHIVAQREEPPNSLWNGVTTYQTK